MIPTPLPYRRSIFGAKTTSDGAMGAFFSFIVTVQGEFYLMLVSRSEETSRRRR